jgi:hypothetical protein
MYAPLDPGESKFMSRKVLLAAMGLYYSIMFLAAILCIVVYTKLSPVFYQVSAVVDKAEVLFTFLYQFACEKERLLNPQQCAILGKLGT